MTTSDIRRSVTAVVYGMLSAASLLGTWIIGCVAQWPASVLQSCIASGFFVITLLIAGHNIRKIGQDYVVVDPVAAPGFHPAGEQ